MKDGYYVLVKVPHKIAIPRKFTVTSEVATLYLLRCAGVPVPKVQAYWANNKNSVGAEYILFEKLKGQP